MTTFNFLGTAQTCDRSWCNFFNNPKIQNELLTIGNTIGNNYTPQLNDIFKVFQTNLANCKVVILGQDPYPQLGVATGRAFEVGKIKSWQELNNNPSLRNILKLLYKNHKGIPTVPSIDEVKKDIDFILPPDELFDSWEIQGVLLLNTALTCLIDTAGSHVEYWKVFTEETIKFIDANTQDVTWFLWGNEGKSFCHLISNGIKYCSKHPRINDEANLVEGTFYYENHFSNVTSINWYKLPTTTI